MTWKAVFDQGVACFDRGDLAEALVHMNQAAEIDGSIFSTYDLRAEIHEKLGNIEAALLDSERVADLVPDHYQGHVRSAHLLNLLGKNNAAIKVVDRALSHLRLEDASTSLVKPRERSVATQVATDKQETLQVSQISYVFGKLPVETLVEIFTILVNEDHTWSVKLSHICGHWRRILINTPSAWRTLVLSRKDPLQKARLWKERAENRITCILADMSELDRASVFAQLRDLCWDDLLTLCISGNAFVELHHMLSEISLPHTFSNLGELSLFDYGTHDQFSCCLSGPSWKLNILHLSGVIHMMDEWWLRIRQLRELYLDGHLIRFSTSVLTANPSLEKLSLSCLNSDPDMGSIVTPTSMDNLKTVECRGILRPFNILHAISAPSITHLRIFSGMVSDESLHRFASRSSLIELHLGHLYLYPSTLPTLLSSTPNLETLRINYIQSVVNEVFQFLTPDTTNLLQGPPCRALKHVDVSHCSDLTTSSVYAFVKTRTHYASESVGSAERCAAVASLKLDGCPNIEPDLLPWFKFSVTQFSWKTRKKASVAVFQ